MLQAPFLHKWHETFLNFTTQFESKVRDCCSSVESYSSNLLYSFNLSDLARKSKSILLNEQSPTGNQVNSIQPTRSR
jgi:hypothetical protein